MQGLAAGAAVGVLVAMLIPATGPFWGKKHEPKVDQPITEPTPATPP